MTVDTDKINKMIEGIENVFKIVNPDVPELMFAVSDILCHYAVEFGIPQDQFLIIMATNFKQVLALKEENSVKIKEQNKIQEVIVK